MKKLLFAITVLAVSFSSFAQMTLTQSFLMNANTQLPFTANVTSNQLTILNHGLVTGDEVMIFTQSATPPSPLNVTSYYYVIAADAAHITLATTLDNALAGTVIDLTTTGSGKHAVIKSNVIFENLVTQALKDASVNWTTGALTLATINASDAVTPTVGAAQVKETMSQIDNCEYYNCAITRRLKNDVTKNAVILSRRIFSIDADINTAVINAIKMYSSRL